MQDILTKCIGTSNPHNVIHATVQALQQLRERRRGAARARQDARVADAVKGTNDGAQAESDAGSLAASTAPSMQKLTINGPRAHADAQVGRAQRHCRDPRHDSQGLAPCQGGGRGVRTTHGNDTTHADAERRAPRATRSGSAAVTARVCTRPPARARRARRPAPATTASRSRASKAARCRCRAACPSGASRTTASARKSSRSTSATSTRASRRARSRIEALKDKGLVPRSAELVKILGDGQLTKKLTIVAHYFSSVAKEKIEKAGGVARRHRAARLEGSRDPHAQ